MFEQPDETTEPPVCDSCGDLLGPDDDQRLRHPGCPVPPLPEAALEAIEMAHRLVTR